MNENRRQILEMLAAGKITADEAERLIAALEKEPAAGPPNSSATSGSKSWPQYLRVEVDAEEEKPGRGQAKVNVRVPMQLLRAGVKLASIIPPQARLKVEEALHEKGIAFDLSQVKPENLEELIYHLKDLTVDIGEEKKRVRVYCE